MNLPTKKEAEKLLEKHVEDEYQKLHAHMIATAMEKYAEKYDGDPELWYITGLLHDLDYYEFPDEHPKKAIEWFEEKNYPQDLINAIGAHAPETRKDYPLDTNIAKALLAIDELAGLIYAYSLMRPTGFEGMKAKKVKKKMKNKGFAAKIDRSEINKGIEVLGIEPSEHFTNLIAIFTEMNIEKV